MQAKRLPDGVLILSPNAADDPQAFGRGRVAMRVAYAQGLMPIFPPAFTAAFLAQDELAQRLRQLTLWWYKRLSRIWLCMPMDMEYPELDPLTHDVLLINEGRMVFPDQGRRFRGSLRVSVYRFDMPKTEDAQAEAHLLSREEIGHYLRCNLTAGLFRGLGMEA